MVGPLLDDGGDSAAVLITIGDDGGDDFGFAEGSYGSLSKTTYIAMGGSTRTILAINFDDTSNILHFALSGAVPNDHTAFVVLRVGGTAFMRADATYTNPANSSWRWDTGGANPIGTSPGTVWAIIG